MGARPPQSSYVKLLSGTAESRLSFLLWDGIWLSPKVLVGQAVHGDATRVCFILFAF